MDGILAMEGFDVSLAENLMLLAPFSAFGADEKTVNFVSKFKSLYGDTPNQFAADAYDGIYALYDAAQKAGLTGETTAEDACDVMIEQFQTLTVDGLTGVSTWSSNGEVNKAPKVYVIKSGAYELMD